MGRANLDVFKHDPGVPPTAQELRQTVGRAWPPVTPYGLRIT